MSRDSLFPRRGSFSALSLIVLLLCLAPGSHGATKLKSEKSMKCIPHECKAYASGAAGKVFTNLASDLMAAQCRLTEDWPKDYSYEMTGAQTFDFIIIGSGAGSVLANRLTENENWTVLLIEAGSDPQMENIVPNYSSSTYISRGSYGYYTEGSEDSCKGCIHGSAYWPRGKTLGGTSSINHMLYMRGSAGDYESWHQEEGDGWDWSTLKEYFKKSERMVDPFILNNPELRKEHGTEGEFIVDQLNFTHGDFAERLTDAYKEMGLKYLDDLNGPTQMGVGKIRGGNNKGRRVSTATAFLIPIRERKNLYVMKHTFVHNIEFDKDKRARGVKVSLFYGDSEHYYARKEIIVSGGTVNTPKLLMYSGIGPKEHLESLNITVISDLVGVGKNLQDHVRIPIPITLDTGAEPRGPEFWQKAAAQYLIDQTGPHATNYDQPNINAFLSVPDGKTLPDVQIDHNYFVPKTSYLATACRETMSFIPSICEQFTNWNSEKELLFLLVSLVRPHSKGEILLRYLNTMEQPKIYPRYFSDERDITTFVKAVKKATEIIKTPTFQKMNAELQRIKFGDCDDLEFESDKYWECMARTVTYHAFHPAGTAKMGKAGDPDAVVDSRLRVLGVTGLRVVDASIMPSIPGVNLQAPVMMIAERAADFIKEDHQVIRDDEVVPVEEIVLDYDEIQEQPAVQNNSSKNDELSRDSLFPRRGSFSALSLIVLLLCLAPGSHGATKLKSEKSMKCIPHECKAYASGAAGKVFTNLASDLMAAQCRLTKDWPKDHSYEMTGAQTFDFIIIRSGAGSVLANRLTENENWTVLLIEAGSDPQMENIVPNYSSSTYISRGSYGYYTEESEDSCKGCIHGSAYWPRGKTLGGTSSINHMLYMRGSAGDYESWHQEEGDGWDWPTLKEYFKKSERMVDPFILNNPELRKEHGTEGEFIVDQLNFTHGDFAERLTDAYKEMGLKYLDDLNGPTQMGVGKIRGGNNKGRRVSTATAFLIPIRERKNLYVMKHTFVHNIEFDKDKRARGVKVSLFYGDSEHYYARKEIIVSGGTVNTPKLLMYSGIGPKEHLESLNITVISDLVGVGKNLQDHVRIPIPITLDTGAEPRGPEFWQKAAAQYLIDQTGPHATNYDQPNFNAFLSVPDGKTLPDVQIDHNYFVPKTSYLATACRETMSFIPSICEQFTNWNSEKELLFLLVSLVRPHSKGEILLRYLNTMEQPKIYPRYFSDERDITTFVKAVKKATEIIKTPTFQKMNAELQRIKFGDCDDLEFESDKYWECMARTVTYHAFHPAGTAKMGKAGDPDAVVDSRLRVLGVTGLRVVDASIMPSIPGVNLQAPVMMIAERAADFIKEDHQVIRDDEVVPVEEIVLDYDEIQEQPAVQNNSSKNDELSRDSLFPRRGSFSALSLIVLLLCLAPGSHGATKLKSEKSMKCIPHECKAYASGAAGKVFTNLASDLMAAQCRLTKDWPKDHSYEMTGAQTFDFIIIRSGAGSVLANRLTENENWTVLLIEAGSDPQMENIVPNYSSSTYISRGSYGYYTEESEDSCKGCIHGSAYWPRGKTLGGTSSINHMLYMRGSAGDYESWHQEEGDGWDWPTLKEYFKKSERMVDPFILNNPELRKERGTEGEFIVDQLNFTHGDFAERLTDAYKEMGLKYLDDLNGPTQMGVGKIRGGNNKGRRVSTATAFLIPIRERKNLYVMKHTFVHNIEFDKDKRARGVKVSLFYGDSEHYYARKEIIVSGGTVNTPKLLMYSGIGPKEHLESLNITVISDLVGVGKNLQDHVRIPIPITLDTGAEPRGPEFWQKAAAQYLIDQTGPHATNYDQPNFNAFLSVPDGKTLPDVQIDHNYFVPKTSYLATACRETMSFIPSICEQFTNWNSEKELLFLLVSLVRPHSKGEILLRYLNTMEQPKIYPRYFSDERDITTFVKAVKRATEIIKTPTFQKMNAELQRIKFGDCDDLEFESDKYWECMARTVTYHAFHPAGTAKMGKAGDPDAVVDSRLRVLGVTGLRVVDASIMPSIPGVNLQAPVMMIAERAADFIKEDHQVIRDDEVVPVEEIVLDYDEIQEQPAVQNNSSKNDEL